MTKDKANDKLLQNLFHIIYFKGNLVHGQWSQLFGMKIITLNQSSSINLSELYRLNKTIPDRELEEYL